MSCEDKKTCKNLKKCPVLFRNKCSECGYDSHHEWLRQNIESTLRSVGNVISASNVSIIDAKELETEQ